MLQCKSCDRYLPETMYYRQTSNGSLWRKCKDCIREQRQIRHEADPSKRKALAHAAKLKKYDLTQEQFDAMLEAQQHACWICLIKFTDTPHIDHCHRTNVVRGLLCGKCNQALGLLDDEIPRLKRALIYLETLHGSPDLHCGSDGRVSSPADD